MSSLFQYNKQHHHSFRTMTILWILFFLFSAIAQELGLSSSSPTSDVKSKENDEIQYTKILCDKPLDDNDLEVCKDSSQQQEQQLHEEIMDLFSSFDAKQQTQQQSSIPSSVSSIPRGGSSSSSSSFDNVFTDPHIPLDTNIPLTPAEYEAALLERRRRQYKLKKKK